jgi:hypothetical protein
MVGLDGATASWARPGVRLLGRYSVPPGQLCSSRSSTRRTGLHLVDELVDLVHVRGRPQLVHADLVYPVVRRRSPRQ